MYVIRFYALKSQLHEKRGKARKSVLIRAQSSLSSLKDNIQPKTDFHSKRNYMKLQKKQIGDDQFSLLKLNKKTTQKDRKNIF